MFNPRRLLVPIDFSEESRLALDWAIMLAKRESGSSILLCHILSMMAVPIGPEAAMYDYPAMEKFNVEKKMEEWRNTVPPEIVSTVVWGQGRVSSEVARLCREHQIDLVVMTTHGRQGLQHFVFGGSVTEHTVREAPGPVLVLHLNQAATAAARAAM